MKQTDEKKLETHRAAVVWICGVPFVAGNGKDIAHLLRLSAQMPRLEVLTDGRLAALTRAATYALENQMVSKIELADVVCTACEDETMSDDERADRVHAILSDPTAGLLSTLLAAGRAARKTE